MKNKKVKEINNIIREKYGVSFSRLSEDDSIRVCAEMILSEDFIRKYKRFVDWTTISKYQSLSEDFISEFYKYVDWKMITKYQKLRPSYIWRSFHNLNRYYLCIHQKLDMEFIKEKYDLLYPDKLMEFQKLDPEFVEKIILGWNEESSKPDIYSRFLGVSFDKILRLASEHQKLSEYLIERFSSYIDWHLVSANQDFSLEFLNRNLDKINVRLAFEVNSKLNDEVRSELEDMYLFGKELNLFS